MSYRLNKTDGTLLIDLIDGEIDSTSSDLIFVGRNYKGYGEFFNENFIALLENFANSAAPSRPLEGQLWYNTAAGRLEVYDGAGFKAAGGPSVQITFPNNPVAGDLFINSEDKQFFFYDGTSWILAGPMWTSGQGKSGFETNSVLDTLGRSRVVIKQFIQGSLVGVWSNIEFTPISGSSISGISNPIKKGFTPVDQDEFLWNGTVLNSQNLIDDVGTVRNASNFLPADSDGTTVGTLTIQNTGGLTIGTAQNNVQKIVGSSVVSEMGLLDNDYKIRVRSSAFGSLIVDAIVIDSSTGYVGIFESAPQATLDVDGNVRIQGNLTVEGTTTNIDVATLQVEDINIELGITDDSTLLDDASVDDGGIILRASGIEKKLTWKVATDAWTSSRNFDLSSGFAYHVGGNEVLSQTALGATVTSADGLTSIGTLDELDVDNINLNGVTVTTTGAGLNINSAGTITLTSSQRITGLATPTSGTDAANKDYVDNAFSTAPVILSLDITGLVAADVAYILEELVPASSKDNGTFAYLATIDTALGATVSGIVVDIRANTDPDNGEVLALSKIAVDSNGTQNESVVQDVAANNTASGTVNLTVTRGFARIQVNGGIWDPATYVTYTYAAGIP